MNDLTAARAAVDALMSALDDHDLAAVEALCHPDLVFIGSAMGEEARGRDGLRQMYAKLAPMADDLTFELAWEPMEVELIGNGIALVTGIAAASARTSTEQTEARYRLSGLLEMTDGRWLWRLYHGSEAVAW